MSTTTVQAQPAIKTAFVKTDCCIYKVSQREVIRVSDYGIDIYRKTDGLSYNYFMKDAIEKGTETTAENFLKAFDKQWMKIAGTLSKLRN